MFDFAGGGNNAPLYLDPGDRQRVDGSARHALTRRHASSHGALSPAPVSWPLPLAPAAVTVASQPDPARRVARASGCELHARARARTPTRCGSCARRAAPLSAMAQLGRLDVLRPGPVVVGAAVLRVLPQPGARLRAGRRRAGDVRRPVLVAPGRARGAVADVSRAAAEFQHRPRQRGERDRQPGAARRAGARRRARAQDRAGHAAPARPISCRRAACSGTGAPTRCRIRRCRRCSTRWRWTAAASRMWPPSCAKRPTPRASRSCSARRCFDTPQLLVAEAMFAVARYQIEEPSFHPYTSKFDFWLEGKARLSAAELRGYLLFNDPQKANCAGCHLDQPSPDGLPPLFTDHQFEALGVPRNPDARGEPRSRLLRSRHLRPLPHRHAAGRRSIAACF